MTRSTLTPWCLSQPSGSIGTLSLSPACLAPSVTPGDFALSVATLPFSEATLPFFELDCQPFSFAQWPRLLIVSPPCLAPNVRHFFSHSPGLYLSLALDQWSHASSRSGETLCNAIPTAVQSA